MSKLGQKVLRVGLSFAVASMLLTPVFAENTTGAEKKAQNQIVKICRTDASKAFTTAVKKDNADSKSARILANKNFEAAKVAYKTAAKAARQAHDKTALKAAKDALKTAQEIYKTALRKIQTDHKATIKIAQSNFSQAKKTCKAS